MLDKRIMTLSEKNNKFLKYNTMKFLGLPLPPLLLRCHDPSLEVSTTRGYTLIPRMMMSNIRVFAIPIDIQMSISQRQYPSDRASSHTYTTTNNNNNNAGDIHIATCNGDDNCVTNMVNRTRELLWCKDDQGNIPLHLALEKGHKKIAMYLIKEFPQGSYALNQFEKSPLYLGVVNDHKDLVDFMLANLANDKEATKNIGKGKSILLPAITAKNQEMVQVIMKHRPKLIKPTNKGNNEELSPLSCAAHNGLTDIIGLFLSKYPDLAHKDYSYPIHKACIGGHVDILKMFHTRCPNYFTKPNENGLTILHLAAKEPNNKLKDVVSYLLRLPERTKLLKMEDQTNRTPLKLARYIGNNEVAEMMEP
ncbi:uncharacterized protein LOC141631604 [Silene latifolia]|uniref:uncharacterized protein LOC141631604 n=1 Tax=Silene latifolia TaxID=37657 RepID=UPI003D779AFE